MSKYFFQNIEKNDAFGDYVTKNDYLCIMNVFFGKRPQVPKWKESAKAVAGRSALFVYESCKCDFDEY